jgi:hypothetical protein
LILALSSSSSSIAAPSEATVDTDATTNGLGRFPVGEALSGSDFSAGSNDGFAPLASPPPLLAATLPFSGLARFFGWRVRRLAAAVSVAASASRAARRPVERGAWGVTGAGAEASATAAGSK